jgi:folate-binding protein YgfZ
MSHNPDPTLAPDAEPFFALPGHRVIALSGRDAVVFAQAQLMNDVEAILPGHWQWSGWLTPKGRVIAVFALLRVANDALWLIVPDADATELATKLQRFVLRRQLVIDVRTDLHVSGRLDAPEDAHGASFAGDQARGIELDVSGFGIRRTLRIDREGAPHDAALEARWLASDLRLGFPRLAAAQAEQWTPQMLSLERLHAFSVKKGCYPGQEIVARTHFLGQAKRGLVFFEAPEPPESGADVIVGAASLGQIVSVARNGAQWVALAVLPFDRADASHTANGIPLRERALLAGLAR